MTIEELTTLDKLNKAFYAASKMSKWKPATQRYHSKLLLNNTELQDDLRSGRYQMESTINFWINERGKRRYIESPKIRDRIVQKVLTTEVLIPHLTKPLIYDNYASLKGRGTSFARKRIDVMLRRYIQKHGSDGYVLLVDIKQYFPSIDHAILKEMVHKQINEPPDIMGLIDYVIDSSSDSDKGLNLGSEAPQIFAIYYLNPVDTYVKTVKGVKYYGRYMDDIIVLSNSKEELRELLEGIKEQLSRLNLEINERKTHITKLSRGFTFLQVKYHVDGTKVIKRPTHKKLARERRRLRKFRKLCDRGEMTELEIHNAYKSWRNTVIKDCNACDRSIKSIDDLYEKLFPEHEQYVREMRKDVLRDIRKEFAHEICRRTRHGTVSGRKRGHGLYHW